MKNFSNNSANFWVSASDLLLLVLQAVLERMLSPLDNDDICA